MLALITLGFIGLAIGTSSGPFRRVEVTVLVTPPEIEPQTLLDVADRLTYADEMIRMFDREPNGFRQRVKTLFVPVDSGLEFALRNDGLTLSAIQSPTSLTRRLARIHSTEVPIDFTLISKTGTVTFLTISGQRLRIEYERGTGDLNLIRPDMSRVKIVATDVFVGDIIVHLIDAPISLP